MAKLEARVVPFVPQVSLEMYEIAEPTAHFFYPDIREGYVCKVYDGDTIHVVSPMEVKYCRCHDGTDQYCGHGYLKQYHKFKIRLAGIDTPEIKGHDKGAMEARHALAEKVLNRIVEISVTGQDKYGRLLAFIYVDGDDVCAWLIKHGYAVAYDGGKKTVFEKQAP